MKYTTQPLVPEPKSLEVKSAIEEFKMCESPDTDQIPA
jgi:hypothetical protein